MVAQRSRKLKEYKRHDHWKLGWKRNEQGVTHISVVNIPDKDAAI